MYFKLISITQLVINNIIKYKNKKKRPKSHKLFKKISNSPKSLLTTVSKVVQKYQLNINSVQTICVVTSTLKFK